MRKVANGEVGKGGRTCANNVRKGGHAEQRVEKGFEI